jgi:hypothetical protein
MSLRSWWTGLRVRQRSVVVDTQVKLDVSQSLPHNRTHNMMLIEHWRMHENLAEAQKAMLSIRILVVGPEIMDSADGQLYAETRQEANRLRDSILDMMGVN